ncbi:MAG: hypothetical protein QOI45_220 [Thermoleophilaceae bacterium]|jgi:hypothetical protein|nr:hypothetical protein [Thermoleophilaceae bacterium]
MAVYVDEAIWWWRERRWCHLTADSPEELHEFAAQLGLLRQWFQTKPTRPWTDHYDLPEEVRVQAIACGAQPLTTREQARRLARLREQHRLVRECRATTAAGGTSRPYSDSPTASRASRRS